MVIAYRQRDLAHTASRLSRACRPHAHRQHRPAPWFFRSPLGSAPTSNFFLFANTRLGSALRTQGTAGVTTTMPPTSKKQAKAAAFRAKGKEGTGKKKIKFEDLQALPDTDDGPEPDTSAAPAAPAKAKEGNKDKAVVGQKRKRDADAGSGAGVHEQGNDAAEAPEGEKNSGGKSHKRRMNKQAAKANKYILFVGSLSPTVLPADLESHFGGFCAAKPTSVRLLTQPWDREGLSKLPARQRASVLARTEPPPPGAGGKSKGCAFVEFDNAAAAQEALLKGHGTFLKGKNISVELTAGMSVHHSPLACRRLTRTI